MFVRGMDEEKKSKFDTELNAPLTGAAQTPTPFEIEQEAEGFMALYAQVSGGQV